MLARARIVTLLIFLAAATHLIYHTWHISSEDHLFYEKMTYQKKQADKSPLSNQEKLGIQKCMYFNNDAARETTLIEAESSDVKAVPKGKSYEFIETLSNISGSMDTAEQYRTFSAQTGTFFYSSSRFISPKALIKLYSDTLLLDGIASDVCIGFDDHRLRFEAGQVKALLPNLKEFK